MTGFHNVLESSNYDLLIEEEEEELSHQHKEKRHHRHSDEDGRKSKKHKVVASHRFRGNCSHTTQNSVKSQVCWIQGLSRFLSASVSASLSLQGERAQTLQRLGQAGGLQREGPPQLLQKDKEITEKWLTNDWDLLSVHLHVGEWSRVCH